jgi:hypothetical protein
MNSLADRRTRMRYEVVGALRGTLEMSELVRIQNISSDGALIETSTPVPVGATQSIQMTLDGHSARVISRVRHVTPMGRTPTTRYAVGVEFVSHSDALASSVTNLIAERKSDIDRTSEI